MTRVLIVEDDESIALGLRMNLTSEGYEVATESDGEAGLEHALRDPPDLMILDVMLPKQNGFEVVQHLRERRSTVPVIMLTARGAEIDKVMGLNLGAEDYVTKPFGLAELLARVKAVLRRGEMLRAALAEGATRVVAGQLIIDANTRQVHRAGELVN
ncbi:MAG TPA: response regulator transcription factor, partial [Polyangiaceae bacterium]|nr:response regulator transcription factor [Polyangiaceae bacterium]